MSLGLQIITLFVLAIPVACVAWTVTHEEVFREPRDYCKERSERAPSLWTRKFYYMLTCEYCFSHYVAAAFLALTHYKLLYADWRGYLVAFFSLVWIANIYIGIFGQVKLGMKKERAEIQAIETDVNAKKDKEEGPPALHRPAA
jgi:hypothetical protein